MTKRDAPESAHFPPMVREWLRRAALLKNPAERRQAIEMATKMARMNYPELFRKGK